MKLRCEVLAVETFGDRLKITTQGRRPNDAEWRPYLKIVFELHDSPKTRKAMHVGRMVRIDITT